MLEDNINRHPRKYSIFEVIGTISVQTEKANIREHISIKVP